MSHHIEAFLQEVQEGDDGLQVLAIKLYVLVLDTPLDTPLDAPLHTLIEGRQEFLVALTRHVGQQVHSVAAQEEEEQFTSLNNYNYYFHTNKLNS